MFSTAPRERRNRQWQIEFARRPPPIFKNSIGLLAIRTSRGNPRVQRQGRSDRNPSVFPPRAKRRCRCPLASAKGEQHRDYPKNRVQQFFSPRQAGVGLKMPARASCRWQNPTVSPPGLPSLVVARLSGSVSG